jgi:hypothetical protein
MIWRATVRVHHIPVRWSERLIGGEEAIGWKLFGFIPVLTASGDDITRSTVGRVAAESAWLPLVLCSDTVLLTEPDALHLRASLPVQGRTVPLEFSVGHRGRIDAVFSERPSRSDYQ